MSDTLTQKNTRIGKLPITHAMVVVKAGSHFAENFNCFIDATGLIVDDTPFTDNSYIPEDDEAFIIAVKQEAIRVANQFLTDQDPSTINSDNKYHIELSRVTVNMSIDDGPERESYTAYVLANFAGFAY